MLVWHTKKGERGKDSSRIKNTKVIQQANAMHLHCLNIKFKKKSAVRNMFGTSGGI